MKILIWSQYFWPENFRINDVAKALLKRGLSVVVLTGKPNYPIGKIFAGYRVWGIHREQFQGVSVIRVPLVPRGNRSALRMVLNYFSFIVSGAVLGVYALWKEKFDLVFVYAPSPLIQALPAILISWIKGSPLVVWVQDLWPESLVATGFVKNKLILRFVEYLVRFIYSKSDLILIQSEAFREPVSRLVSDKTKIHYYPNTIASSDDVDEQFVNTSLLEEVERTFSIVFGGNIGVAQGMGTLLQAAESLQGTSNIRFFIIGDGSKKKWVASEVSRRGLNNVVLVDHMSYSQISLVYSRASALLITLKDDQTLSNTVPSKLQAYLSSSKPIIGSVNGETARIIKEANAGFVCSAEDSQALAQIILELSQLTSSQRARIGEEARKYFDLHFEPTLRLEQLIEHFQNAVRK